MDISGVCPDPGPTPVPERVLRAIAQHPIGHRSGEVSAMIGEIIE